MRQTFKRILSQPPLRLDAIRHETQYLTIGPKLLHHSWGTKHKHCEPNPLQPAGMYWLLSTAKKPPSVPRKHTTKQDSSQRCSQQWVRGLKAETHLPTTIKSHSAASSSKSQPSARAQPVGTKRMLTCVARGALQCALVS